MDPTFSRFDAAARGVIVAAQRTAAGAGQARVSVRSLLAAVAVVDAALVDFVLGADAGWWHRLSGPCSQILPETHNLPWDDDAKQALRAAVSQSGWEARRDAAGDAATAPVTPEHLLIGALGAPPTMAVLADFDLPIAAAVGRARTALGPRPVAHRAAVRRTAPLASLRHAGPQAPGVSGDDHAETVDRARQLDIRRTVLPGQGQGASDDELAACVVHFTALARAYPHDPAVRRAHVLALTEQGPWDAAAEAADAAARDPDPLVRNATIPIADRLQVTLALLWAQPLGDDVHQRISRSLTGPEPWPTLPAVRAETAALLAVHDGQADLAVLHLDSGNPQHAATRALALFRAGQHSAARTLAVTALHGASRQSSWRSEHRWARWVHNQVGA